MTADLKEVSAALQTDDGHLAKPEPQEAQRWPMSEASQLLVDASNENLDAAREKCQEAVNRHQSRITAAMRIDGLPTEVGPPTFLGAKREGDEWVELTQGDIERQ